MECWKDRETYPIISRRNFVVKFWKKLLNVQKWGFSRKKSENPFKFYFLSKSLLPPTMLLSWEPKKTRQSCIIQSHWKNSLYCPLLYICLFLISIQIIKQFGKLSSSGLKPPRLCYKDYNTSMLLFTQTPRPWLIACIYVMQNNSNSNYSLQFP